MNLAHGDGATEAASTAVAPPVFRYTDDARRGRLGCPRPGRGRKTARTCVELDLLSDEDRDQGHPGARGRQLVCDRHRRVHGFLATDCGRRRRRPIRSPLQRALPRLGVRRARCSPTLVPACSCSLRRRSRPYRAFAHHSSQAEFGPFASPTTNVEARIVEINWGNPHISMDLAITGGALPVGEHWRLVSHPCPNHGGIRVPARRLRGGRHAEAARRGYTYGSSRCCGRGRFRSTTARCARTCASPT